MVVVLLVMCSSQGALAEVAGRYTTKGQNINVTIQSWGDDCGPRPRSASGGGGKVVDVRRVGTHLSVGGHRTDVCWSRNPRVKRVRASGTANRWSVVCETPRSDPRFEHGEYTISTVDDSTLRFREVSAYDWRLEGDHCKATVILTRTYVRIPDSGATEPDPPDPDPDPDPPPASSKCRGTRGDPVRLEIRPSRSRIGPGDRFCFRAVGRDREGCLVPVKVIWRRVGSGDGGQLAPDGCFVATKSISGAVERVTVVAAAGKLIARAQVEIRIPDIGDLVAARLAEGTEEGVGEAPNVVEARPGAAQGVGETHIGPVQEERGYLWVIVVVGLGAAVMLFVVAFALLRRRRDEEMAEIASDDALCSSIPVARSVPPLPLKTCMQCPTCGQEFTSDIEFCPDDAARLIAIGREDGSNHQSMICPRCRRGFEGGEKYCSKDSEELIPYSVWRVSQLEARKANTAQEGGMICPKCASRYNQDIIFCQKDGTKLEPIN